MIMLETAPLIESDGLVPDAAQAEMALLATGDGALEVVLRQLGASEAPGAAEARGELLLDLFVDARCGYVADGAQRDTYDVLTTLNQQSLAIPTDNDATVVDGKDIPMSAGFAEPGTVGSGSGFEAWMRYESIMPSGYY